MIKHPLFGKDSSPQYTAPRLGIIGTIIIWLIFLICGLFIHPFKKPKYETVQIVLESTPIEPTEKNEVLEKSKTEVAKTTSEIEPAKPAEEIIKETPAPVTQPKIETPKKVEQTPAKTEPKKVESPKTETQTYTKAPEYQLKKSVDDLMAEQEESRQENSKSFDWSQFDDSQTENVTQNAQIQQQIDNKSAISGSAGSAATSKTSSSTTTSTTTPTTSENKTASSSTTSFLGKIAATEPLSYSSKSSDGTSESVALVNSAKTAEGKVTVAMDDGSNRTLIKPSKPVINISDENAKLISSTSTVTISFSVRPAGNVPASMISISPSKILPSAVQNEIIDQLSEWRFETSDYTSTAQFEFTIVVK